MKMTHLLYRDCEKFECLLAYARGKSLAIQWSRQRPQLHIIANCRLLHLAAPLKGAALAHHHALEHNSLRLRVVRHQHLRWQPIHMRVHLWAAGVIVWHARAHCIVDDCRIVAYFGAFELHCDKRDHMELRSCTRGGVIDMHPGQIPLMHGLV